MNKEDKINITFPDGKVLSYNIGISCFEIAENISQGFARNQLIASLNDKLVDLSTKINKDSDIMFYGWDSEIGKSTFWGGYIRHGGAPESLRAGGEEA